MIKYHFKIAIRNTLRQKGFAFINVSGMALSFACAILIFLYVDHESSYDKHHSNSENLYRMVWDLNDDVTWVPAGGGWNKILASVPEVEEVVSMDPKWGGAPFLEFENQSFREDRDRVFRTTANFAEVFDLEFVEGDPDQALSNPGSMVISEHLSQKYFGENSGLGKSLKLDKKHLLIVTGVVKSLPDNSHFKVDALYNQGENAPWIWPYAYLLLRPGSDMSQVNAKIDSIHKSRSPDRYQAGQRYHLQHVTDIHLHSKYDYEIGANGDVNTIRSLSGIGVIILLMGCINFINMTTASSSRRAKEISVRKVIGSSKKQLISQFLLETQLISMLAMILALVIIWLTLPLFNELSGRELFLPLDNPMFILAVIPLSVLTGLMAGIYPALVLSGFNPVLALKRASTQTRGQNLVRRVLVIFQFMAAIFLIAGTITITDQVRYLNSKPLGFEKENIIGVELGGKANLKELQTLRGQWNLISAVKNISTANSLPARLDNIGYNVIHPEGRTKSNDLRMYVNAVGVDFVKAMGLQLVDGRDFSAEITADRNNGSFLINQAAVSALGWKNPVGKMLELPNSSPPIKARIVGVIENYNDRSLREDVPPMIFMSEAQNPWFMLVRFNGNVVGVEDVLGSSWNQVFADEPFDYFLMDQALKGLYQEDQKLAGVLGSFAVIAVLIAGLGLFGLSIFIAERMSKEIGIRKVLGARVHQILELLNRQFVILVVLALIIAMPIYYLAMNEWLEGFAYRIQLNWLNLVLAFVLALIIAVSSAGYQTIRAARVNPVDVLKNE